MGTVNVLEAVRADAGVRAVVNVTRDKCYENREWAWAYREDEPMGGHDPYSSSKGAAELVTARLPALVLRRPGGPRLASARAGNVIGGGDWGADRLIPDVMRAAVARRAGRDPQPAARSRPWQHVLDPLSGYLVLAAGAVASDPTRAGGLELRPRRGRRAAGRLDRRAARRRCGPAALRWEHDAGRASARGRAT